LAASEAKAIYLEPSEQHSISEPYISKPAASDSRAIHPEGSKQHPNPELPISKPGSQHSNPEPSTLKSAAFELSSTFLEASSIDLSRSKQASIRIQSRLS